MGRWEPNARGRLELAAMELYTERGFENTTVAEIADRAGLTERTFFRHFADKREMLFSGAAALQELLVRKVDEAPRGLAPLDAVTAALVEVAVEFFEDRREIARARQAIITANVDLQERELVKLAALGSAVGEALRRRGVREPTASLTAEAGIAVFKVAFQRWTDDGNKRPLPELIKSSADELRAVTAGRGTGRRRAGAPA